MKEYYATLGIARGASEDEIRQGYRRMGLKWHPSRVAASEKEAAEEQFRHVAEAYDVLCDPHKRTLYDAQGIRLFTAGSETQAPYEFVGDPLAMFSTFYNTDSPFARPRGTRSKSADGEA